MIDLIFSGIAKAVAAALNLVIEFFLDALGFSMDTFNEVFPYAINAYDTICTVAVALVLIFAALQLFQFFSSRSDRIHGSPFRIITSILLAVGGIYLGNYLLTAIVDLCKAPYEVLKETSYMAATQEDVSLVRMALSVLDDIFSSASILVYLVLIIMIGVNVIKLLLEAVERYVVLFVLLYLSPLAFSTLASDMTEGVFKRYLSMFAGQCLLLILNIWSAKMAISMFASISAVSGQSGVLLHLIIGYAFLKVAQRMDSYLNQLGISAAVTGADLGNELFGSAMALTGGFGRTGSNGSGGVMGLAGKLSSAFNQYTPVGAFTSAIKNRAGAYTQTAGEAMRAGATAAHSAADQGATILDRAGAWGQAASDTFRARNWANVENADAKTMDGNVLVPNDLTDVVQAAYSGHMTEDQLNDLSVRPQAAAAIFHDLEDHPDSGVSDTATTAAMVKALNVPDSENYIRAAEGTLNDVAPNSAWMAANADGITASYSTESGKVKTMEVKNERQYHAIPSSQQTGFQEFESSGQKYFVRYDAPVERPTPSAPKPTQLIPDPKVANGPAESHSSVRKIDKLQ